MKHAHYQSDLSTHSKPHLLEKLSQGLNEPEVLRLSKALDYAIEARDQDVLKRPRGIDVAHILFGLKVDAQTLEASLLSDPYLRDHLKEGVIKADFGEAVGNLVAKVNWLNTFKDFSNEQIRQPEQAELLRRMLLAVVNDARAVLIKLAYRVQHLRLLKHQPDESIRENIARETFDLFAPLANRLGVGQLKWELEDLAFRHLQPDEYKRLAKALASNRAERETYIQQFIASLKQVLQENQVQAKVYGRPKHLYSIWKKMSRKHVPLDGLYDLLAVRVMVESLADCYAVLGIAHSFWSHIPEEFDDYIANPKDNGYQSLHTVVIGPGDRPIEIQIRTQEMHSFAEYGVAAHWRYKEGARQDVALDKSIDSLRKLLENKEDDRLLLDDFRFELFANHIFVLTPKGQVVRLKNGATPIDFAYAIHSEVGHRCRGAKVNGAMTPLTHTLKSGEKVEILTAKNGGPSLGWLDPHMGYVKMPSTRSKIKQWFKLQDHEKHWRAGKLIYERERHKLGLPALKEPELNELMRHFHQSKHEDWLAAIGRGDISTVQLTAQLKMLEAQPVIGALPRKSKTIEKESEPLTIQGIRNMLMHYAHCCNPTPGAPIVGYITLGYGVTIHRADCPNILHLPTHKQPRLIDVSWGASHDSFQLDLEIEALDRKGLLKEVSNVLAHEHIQIVRTQSHAHASDQTITLEIGIEISESAQLDVALDKIKRIENVLRVRRK